MAFYCSMHKDEDLNAIRGERLDALTWKMVIHKSYSLDILEPISEKYVIWEMKKDQFGFYTFSHLINRNTGE
ncbi:hypothetical protein SmaMPs15_000036 [Stenotrophomonas maltophilia phage vB_SmaM_Ps15]|uniref:Uncharacterized protein n=1 Tax=Stenotrophomonas maltophilia phage vB_SmaM_Ps15 TaxID=3071007 RepID=A0AAE9FNX1_9CAUD|nr:hypothetical protein PQC01_gp036 [Stenotrophomonas maltophilia phage vB_SmaM_Ps15]UMO77187.1 hypothetical protein SmaMPs15_000036 [Stenotrophomonas maltophilia phage vB_SmaM_Ps15]